LLISCSDSAFVVHLHELLAYLNSRGVITILVSAQHGFLNAEQSSFEAQGAVRQAISVVKNRSEEHERVIREFEISKRGIRIGSPLRQFQGVLTGNPEFSGEAETLIREKDESE
jgi:circadian clock protein KaiC